MPYTTIWKDKGVCWTFHGTVTGKEILQCDLDIYGDERFDCLRYQIADFSGAEGFELNEFEVKKIAYLDKAAAATNPEIKVAIVAPQDFIREMSNLYAKYADDSPWETRIFDTVDQAKQWLGK